MTLQFDHSPGVLLEYPERSYWDAASKCRIVVAVPAAEPTLWRAYLAGARANYRRHGIEHVLDYEAIADGHGTALFFAALAPDGRVLGGVRVQGPYRSAEQSHALVEWADEPGRPTVHRVITERIPDGVVEIKAAWVSDLAVRRHELANSIPRTAVHAAKLLGARFAFATSGVHTLQRWMSTGSEIVPDLTPVRYPDERYRTTMIWLDRTTFADRADTGQLREILTESAQLSVMGERPEPHALAVGGTR